MRWWYRNEPKKIDLEHRLVYKVSGNCVSFLQARYHYQPDG
ncbi:MAG: type II toxin-antitoxin system YoeB family toxin [Gomphosphaeria aponina SAG 52.96 = DSM 107014]|uniref:Endoribonuclease YoeB n=1 Tax=Gomphosphaeria aponina SAG 52.96 = DSM 107014 TaxID=1521640 RepID=A0A941GVE9_9CHRO|nr:type II toxin-antitoxin system YoeB family toxin [Gomphosphaeria aponina SAG 52.96 = DSM 107014]